MKKLSFYDCTHEQLLYPHEHPHINRNTKYTIKCSECGREGFYKRMCTTLLEIDYQDMTEPIIHRYGINSGCSSVPISEEEYVELGEIFGSPYIIDNGVRIDYHDEICIGRHKCGKCDKYSLYVIQNW